jgi:hypothetical protein
MGIILPFPERRVVRDDEMDAQTIIAQAVVAELKQSIDLLTECYPGQEPLFASSLLHRAAEIAHNLGTDVAEIQVSLDLAREVERETAFLTDAQVDATIEEHGGFRD